MTGAFDEEQKRLLAGRSLTLLERIENPEELDHSEPDTQATAEVFQEWRDLFPNEDAFDRRLDREGVSREECLRAIAADRLAADEPLPEWIDVIDDLAAAICESEPSDYSTRVDPEHAPTGDNSPRVRPFGELSAAVATYARDRLSDTPARTVLSEAALDAMTAWFRHRFERRFVRILYVEFKTFVATHDRDLAYADPDEFDDPPTAYYERFLDDLFAGEFVDLCLEYPVFARLVAIQIRQWLEHLEEFSRRLQADHERLAAQFDVDGAIGDVAGLKPLADDTHGDGRAVMQVTFDSGLTLAYKPRRVDSGVAFYRMLGRLDEHLAVPEFETPTYLARDGYGWMEWIEYEECTDRSAVERYYQRAGALLCLTYLIEFTDCHYENLEVAGEQPVLVDAETVLHPHVRVERRPLPIGSHALVGESVLLSSLLPFEADVTAADHGDDREGIASAAAGFGVSSDPAVVEDVSVSKIRAANTDVMTVEHEPMRIDREENVPKIDGEEQLPDEYLDAVVEGFEATYRTILSLRDSGHLSEIGVPDALAGIENRLVYRPTMTYRRILESLSSWDCLRDGARFGVEIERLAVPFCDGSVADPRPWQLYDAERLALKRFDPPRFTSRTDDIGIRMAGSELGVEADTSGLMRSRRRIESASREDMHEQISYIRGCFGASPNPSPEVDMASSSGPKAASSPLRATQSDHARISDEELQREAETIFQEIQAAAYEAADGTTHWLSITAPPEIDRLTLNPTQESLYDGRCGIALLGAALYHRTNDGRYRRFALNTVEPVRDAIRMGRESTTLSSHGGASGIGSVAYGLGALGTLLDEQSLLEDAARAGEFVTQKFVETDRVYDVVGGSAGTILGLLAVDDRLGSSELVATAAACGDHLLANRVQSANGIRVWQPRDDHPPVTGFSHGISGIAYALVRLWDATGTTTYRDAALEALEFESRAYSERAQNWPDTRENIDMTYPDQWCYGRSGIGLARLGMAEYTEDERVSRDLERAIDAMESTLDRRDHLCCGNAGRIEFLLETAYRRDRHPKRARELLGDVLARKRETGRYRTLGGTRQVPCPTLFIGLAGIAYTMLRVTDPGGLPCLLLWE